MHMHTREHVCMYTDPHTCIRTHTTHRAHAYMYIMHTHIHVYAYNTFMYKHIHILSLVLVFRLAGCFYL